MEEVFSLLQQLARSKFYGSLVLKLEAGNVVLLKKEETIKPTICRDNRGNNGTKS
jgi:hypothetical protein